MKTPTEQLMQATEKMLAKAGVPVERPITSASNLHRRATCPASERLERAAPMEAESPDATEGSMLHACLAGDPDAKPVTDEQQWAIETAAVETTRMMASIFLGGEDSAKTLREVELRCAPGLMGHADFIAHANGVALVVDYKFGRDPAPAAEVNWQLRAYACGVANAYGCERVYAAIIQPRLPAPERVTLVEYGPSEIEQARAYISLVLTACRENDAPTVPSAAACKYCRARATCPALVAESSELAKVEPSSVTLANAADYWKKAALVQRHLDAITSKIREFVMSEHSEGRTVPGLAVKEGAKVRVVTDSQAAFTALQLPADVFLMACKVQVGELEAIFKADSGLKGKAATEAFNSALSSCMEVKQSRPSIVASKEEA